MTNSLGSVEELMSDKNTTASSNHKVFSQRPVQLNMAVHHLHHLHYYRLHLTRSVFHSELTTWLFGKSFSP